MHSCCLDQMNGTQMLECHIDQHQHERKGIGADVQHITQQYNWDCGLACVLMVLRALGCRHCELQQLRSLSRTTSVWTVDLAHLLTHFGASVVFTTTTIGINNDYVNEWFYMEHLEHDEMRVQQLFQQADKLGICVQQRSLPLTELVSAVTSGRQMAILLVDRRKVDPWQAAADMAWNYTTGVTSATSYTGHYILLVGYEPEDAAATGDGDAAFDRGCNGTCKPCISRQHCCQEQPETLQVPGQALATPQHTLQHCQQQQGMSPGLPHQDAFVAADTSEKLSLATADDAGNGVSLNPEAAADGCCALGGYFWVHDPARSRGPIRIPVDIVESARKTFGTDEDILLVDIAPLGASTNGVSAVAAACVQSQHRVTREQQQQQQQEQEQQVCNCRQQQYTECKIQDDMQRSRSTCRHDS